MCHTADKNVAKDDVFHTLSLPLSGSVHSAMGALIGNLTGLLFTQSIKYYLSALSFLPGSDILIVCVTAAGVPRVDPRATHVHIQPLI